MNGRVTRLGMRLQPASRRLALPRSWLAVVAALLLALSWQNFLFQTHWHAPGPQAPAAVQGAESSKSDRQAPSDQQPVCPTCLQLANAAPALPSVPPVLEPPFVAGFFLAAFFLVAVTAQGPPRPWRSRAPPSLLRV